MKDHILDLGNIKHILVYSIQTSMNAVRRLIGVITTATMPLVLMHVAVIVVTNLVRMKSLAMVPHNSNNNIIVVHNFQLLTSSDIDECAEGTDECDQQCYNTNGSYFCNCTETGYRLHSDDATCQSECTK